MFGFGLGASTRVRFSFRFKCRIRFLLGLCFNVRLRARCYFRVTLRFG